jgi:prolyl oligopeptidase
MLTTGDNDTRVPPLQARKMTARLQAATRSTRPILLYHGAIFGHVSGVSSPEVLDLMARELSFLCWQLGVEGDST